MKSLVNYRNFYFLVLSLYLDEGELKTFDIALTTVGRGEMPLLKILNRKSEVMIQLQANGDSSQLTQTSPLMFLTNDCLSL